MLVKVNVYVDGFNLYHAIKNLKNSHLKWLNLRSLAEKFIDKKTEVINKVYYFSAVAKHLDQAIQSRHSAYISALESQNIEYVAGNFKLKMIKNGRQKIPKYEEKETDVNIAIHIVRDAFMSNCDKMLVITNDTDITPALKMALKCNQKLQIKVLTPPTYKLHYTLKTIVKQKKPIVLLKEHLERSLLPEQITLPSGKLIKIPKAYL